MASVALHTALIWHDEVMHDLVVDKPRRITLGRDGRSTFTVPELGLPPGFAILVPGSRGYVLALGARMRGTIRVDGKDHDVAALVAASPEGFAAVAISVRDWGVIELDDTGHHKLFFQFVTPEERLRMRARPDSESVASLAFSVVLHTALLFMTFQVAVDDDPFAWPGLRALAGNYPVVRLDRVDPPRVPAPTDKPAATIASAPAPTAPPRTPETPDPGKQGGGARPAPTLAKEPPAVQFLTPRNRQVLTAIAESNLPSGVRTFIQLNRPGPGSGPTRGTGLGTDPLTTTRGNPQGDRGPQNYQPGRPTLDVGPVRPSTCTGPGCVGVVPRGVVRVEPSTSEIDGGLTPSEIDHIVKVRAPLFRMCYQRELDHKAGLAGKLVVFFRIGGDGLVVPDRTTFVDGTTLHDDAVQRCVAANINRLKFPAKGGTANVKYPFVFTQGG